jgi:hypothetical protein
VSTRVRSDYRKAMTAGSRRGSKTDSPRTLVQPLRITSAVLRPDFATGPIGAVRVPSARTTACILRAVSSSVTWASANAAGLVEMPAGQFHLTGNRDRRADQAGDGIVLMARFGPRGKTAVSRFLQENAIATVAFGEEQCCSGARSAGEREE